MKRIYLDVTQWGCTGLLIKDTEIVWAGTTVYPMPVRDKENPYSKMAEEYDIHFIFDDAVPKINFYTIPRVDIMAQDSDGGYICLLYTSRCV